MTQVDKNKEILNLEQAKRAYAARLPNPTFHLQRDYVIRSIERIEKTIQAFKGPTFKE